MKILVINGPNINLLGTREPEKYGTQTFKDLENNLHDLAKELKINIETFQSNIEGEIVSKIQSAMNNTNGIVINPAGYSHTSVAIRDAISATKIPTVEVHLTNIHAREEFRHTCLIAPVCIGQITGFGQYSYTLGIKALIEYLK